MTTVTKVREAVQHAKESDWTVSRIVVGEAALSTLRLEIENALGVKPSGEFTIAGVNVEVACSEYYSGPNHTITLEATRSVW